MIVINEAAKALLVLKIATAGEVVFSECRSEFFAQLIHEMVCQGLDAHSDSSLWHSAHAPRFFGELRRFAALGVFRRGRYGRKHSHQFLIDQTSLGLAVKGGERLARGKRLAVGPVR